MVAIRLFTLTKAGIRNNLAHQYYDILRDGSKLAPGKVFFFSFFPKHWGSSFRYKSRNCFCHPVKKKQWSRKHVLLPLCWGWRTWCYLNLFRYRLNKWDDIWNHITVLSPPLVHAVSMFSILNNNLIVKSCADKHSCFSCILLTSWAIEFLSHEGKIICRKGSTVRALSQCARAKPVPSPPACFNQIQGHTGACWPHPWFSVCLSYIWIVVPGEVSLLFISSVTYGRTSQGDLEVSRKFKPVI